MGKIIPKPKAPEVKPVKEEETENEDTKKNKAALYQKSIQNQTVRTSLRGVLTNTNAIVPERKKLLGE